jgi:hypothetical protein
MPYSSESGRFPSEAASKLGHLPLLKSEWIHSLVQSFERRESSGQANTLAWSAQTVEHTPLRNVWAVDGSFVSVKTGERPNREVAFVKTALLTVDNTRLEQIDKEHPHPLLVRDVLADSAVFHATVFPLRNITTPLGNNMDAVRHIAFDSMRIDQDGQFLETLKWLAYKKWSDQKPASPGFECPCCEKDIASGLPYDAEKGNCPHCKCELLITDMIGFHLDMNEDSAPESVASAYMSIMEHLMLFTAVRLLWAHNDKTLLSETLFIKDGPLTLRAQYSKLVPLLREFLQFAKDTGRPVHVIGQEKSGLFFDHLHSIVNEVEPLERGQKLSYSVLSHRIVRSEVQRAPDTPNPYGARGNWGEKMYVKFEPGCSLVLSVPVGNYNNDPAFPVASDLIGLDRILATLPGLVSHRFEGALFPIELANGIASMSSYPSARILRNFLEQP